MNIWLKNIFVVILIMLSSACSGQSVNQNADATKLAETGLAYPAASGNGAISATVYPAPSENITLATKGPLPTVHPEKSVITGRLLLNKKPVVNATIYLADVQEQGGFATGSYDRSTSPRATTDSEGRFVFADVLPGKYGLIYDNFVIYVALHIPGEAEDKGLMVEAVAGQLVDLGDLNYPELPEP
jgi:protocatechuate 3,4-dioxygenase beta subunit